MIGTDDDIEKMRVVVLGLLENTAAASVGDRLVREEILRRTDAMLMSSDLQVHLLNWVEKGEAHERYI